MPRRRGRAWLLTLASTTLALAVATVAVEGWVRITWKVDRGTPDFYVPDAVVGQRLRAHYDGWFAGVRVHIDNLELRDPRDYELAKPPNTFRILVLGDSVTFGHGSVYEHTYPYLLEQRLKNWQPQTNWQVWNAAVPGYNTTQELAQLLRIGDSIRPDLVIVGFYENDLMDNKPIPTPTRWNQFRAALGGAARRYLWSLEFYRRVLLTLRWHLADPTTYKTRLESLSREEHDPTAGDLTNAKEQQLTSFDWFTDAEVERQRCKRSECNSTESVAPLALEKGFDTWLRTIDAFRQMNADHRYNVVFFLNIVPRTSYEGDFFFDGSSRIFEEFITGRLSGIPVVSCHDAFMHTKPSQMPNASGHSTGNSNVVKADVLFRFVRERLLLENGVARAARSGK